MRRVWNDFLSLFFPAVCWGCEKVLESEKILCADCWEALPFWDTHGEDMGERFLPEAPFAYATAYAVFDQRGLEERGVIQRLIHAFKYSKRLYVGEALARKCAVRVQDITPLRTCDFIIPVPLHWVKRWWRGFNQSEIIARNFYEILGIPLCKHVLIRKRYTKAQVGKSAEERRKSMKEAFAVKHPEHIKGRRILLVDDVVTTGTTVRACAEVLKAAGVREVVLCALAATER